MANPVLRSGDGYPDTNPQLAEAVRRLQRALQRAGLSLAVDGRFGEGTEAAVRSLQRDRGLPVDGVVEANTWDALAPVTTEEGEAEQAAHLEGFRGDLQWVHAGEGHAGKPYWPGGASGVTLDPGVDLGFADASLIEAAYKPLLSPAQFAAVRRIAGMKGGSAAALLEGDTVLQSIRICRSRADDLFHYAAQPYWQAITARFPSLPGADTLASVQTVMLSLAYNRGAGNRALEVLRGPLEAMDWAGVADIVGAMQQDHSLAGIRTRRRMEADLIRKELAGLA